MAATTARQDSLVAVEDNNLRMVAAGVAALRRQLMNDVSVVEFVDLIVDRIKLVTVATVILSTRDEAAFA